MSEERYEIGFLWMTDDAQKRVCGYSFSLLDIFGGKKYKFWFFLFFDYL